VTVSAPVETKVKAGAASGAAVGVITYLLILAVPPFHNGVPDAVVAVIPFAVGWAAHVAAAWLAPHTPRTPPPAAIVPYMGPLPEGMAAELAAELAKVTGGQKTLIPPPPPPDPPAPIP
jgi:hypothetical protein